MENNYDLAIIGGGPVGLFAHYFASLHGLKTVLLESLELLGGQPAQLYPAKAIKDIPLFSNINGDALTKKLIAQLSTRNTTIKTSYQVKTIVKKPDRSFLINDEITSKTVVIATGAGSFSPKRLPLELPDAVSQHIHYFINDLEIYRDKNVAVLGGGDSAVDWVDLLSKNKIDTTLIHRRNQFRALEDTVSKIRVNKHAHFLTPYLPTNFSYKDKKIYVTLKNVKTDEIKNLVYDEIVVAYGFKTSNEFVDNWGISNKGGFIDVDSSMQTNIPGIFAIGDAITYDARVPVIALGFGEAQIAITTIVRNLFPEKGITLHSTSIKE